MTIVMNSKFRLAPWLQAQLPGRAINTVHRFAGPRVRITKVEHIGPNLMKAVYVRGRRVHHLIAEIIPCPAA